jgi:hypothetical protein
MVNPDEDILQQFAQEEPSESPLTLLAGNTTTANDATGGGLNAYRASGASVQPAKSAAEIYNQLHPEAATRIQRFFELADERGLGLKPGSMNRDYGTQAKMYANRASNPYPVAPPGGSAHMGFATDFSGYKPEKLQAIRELAKEVGLVYGGNWSGKTFDPVHIQLGPGNEVTRYIQQHINPQAGSVNWEGVRTTALPEDFLKRAIAAAQGQNVDAIYVPTKEVKVEGATNATGSATVEPDAIKEADAKVEVTKKRKDIDFAKLIKMLDDSTHGGADYLSRSMQANAQQAQANRSRSLAQIAQFDQEQVNKMAEALKGGKPQGFKEGGEFEESDNPYKDQVVKEYKPTLRDRIANLLAGDEPSFDKQRIVENVAGSRGIGATGVGALDFVPIVGNALGADESLREGDYKGAALAIMPMGSAVRNEQKVLHAAEPSLLKALERIKPDQEQPLRVWHGSPYKFEEFDSSKLGTGEGQRLYGNGIYFAQDKNRALEFVGNPEDRYRRFSGLMNPKEEIAFDLANRPNARDMDIMSALAQKYGIDMTFDEAQSIANEAMKKRGSLYEVDIKKPEHSFLHWQKPLADQSPEIKKALTPEMLGLREAKLPNSNNYAWVDETGMPVGMVSTKMPNVPFEDRMSGQQIYQMIGRHNADRATGILKDLGVAGNVYIDPKHFGKPKPAHNFVVFNPEKDAEIINRYADGGLVTDNGQTPDGTGRQHYDAYGNVSDAQGGPVRAVAYDQDRVNTLAQQLNEGTYG